MSQKINKLQKLYGNVYIRELNNYYVIIDKDHEDWMLEVFWEHLEELIETQSKMKAYMTIRGIVDLKVIKK